VIPLSSVSKGCDSATTWELANFWLQRCVNGHEKCKKLAQADPKLPTRLIDLGSKADAVQPRLCHSVDLPHCSKYATLSHRWVGTVMPMLTFTNLQHWLNAIPVSNLSLTFKEAMEATKRLGLRYLWIDSLCIIQDSEEDWRRESAAMGDIYRNSYFSISAAAGQSITNQGLFMQRDPRDVYPCVVKPLHLLCKGRDFQAWYCFPRDLFEQNVTNSPLFARGWVVQEHILAPRILHFTKQQLFWECTELQACESLPAGVLDTKKMRQKKLGIDVCSSEVQVSYRNSPYMATSERQFLWNEVVERFSKTELTYPDKDKLAALSGLAKAIGISSEYLAGLWKDHLVFHLMWGRYAGSAILERPSKYQAPSWSWASVNGRILTTHVWPLKGDRVVADVLDVSVELLSSDPTGPVKAGYVRLLGCLAPVTVRKWPPREGCSEIWYYDIREEPTRNDKMLCQPDIDFDGDEAPFHAFLITLRSQYPKFDYVTGDGILLEPTGNRKGEFYRRGRFMCGAYQTTENMLPFINLFKFSPRTLDSEHYIRKTDSVEWVHKLSMYEISII
jgi:hypothetical protein